MTLTAGIDSAGRYHVAAACGTSVRYYFAPSAAGPWTPRVFAHASNRQEFGPQIAFDGDRVYVAYTRFDLDGGCGTIGKDIGVYFRSRVLPNGAWSAATKIGAVADTLQSFQIAAGTIYATAYGLDGKIYYETLAGSAYHRTLLAHAVGWTSLQVGSDGRARVAYQIEKGLRLAVFTGTAVSTSAIGGTTNRDWAPLIGLGASDAPFVVWTRAEAPGGCASGGPEPQDGTYFATQAGATWASRRITKDTGQASLLVDPTTDRALVVVSGEKGLHMYTRTADGTWSISTLATTRWSVSPVIRLDPVSGKLLVAYIDSSGDASSSGSDRIEIITTK